MESAICLDIGGTFVKYGLVDPEGRVTMAGRQRTSIAGRDALLCQVFMIIEELLTDAGNGGVAGIGIASAGQVSHEAGVVLSATGNLPGWSGVRLKEIVEDRFSITCHIDNDVKCAALGELFFGSGRQYNDFLCMTIGTGIGGAIVCNGRLLRGTYGIAGEIGHIILHKGGRSCNCGCFGCYEQYASVSSLMKTVSDTLGSDYIPADAGAEWLFAQNGMDSRLNDILDAYAEDIAAGIASLVHVLNPEAVIIGGAISSCKLLMDLVGEKVIRNVMPIFQRSLKVMPALTGNNASILGVSTYLFSPGA